MFRQTPDGGTVAAVYVEPQPPRTSKQTQAKMAMARAGQGGRDLRLEQAGEWERRAASLTPTAPAPGKRRVPQRCPMDCAGFGTEQRQGTRRLPA